MSTLADDAMARLGDAFAAAANPERASSMAAYMKNHFEFLGIAAPERRKLQRIAWAGLPRTIDEADVIAIVDACWAEPQREFQYAGMELLDRQIVSCSAETIGAVERYIQTKSWWDTVDDLCRHSAGELVRAHPTLRVEMNRWSNSGELWLVRSAILHQERWRDQIDIAWVEATCLQHAGHRDFFIRKAIGWILRSYAHHGPSEAARVREFLSAHGAELSPLSQREALNRVRH